MFQSFLVIHLLYCSSTTTTLRARVVSVIPLRELTQELEKVGVGMQRRHANHDVWNVILISAPAQPRH